MIKTVNTDCNGCNSSDSKFEFFEHLGTPADCGFLARTRQEALECQMGPIKLVACSKCGLVQNEKFDPRIIQFQPGYEVSLEHSDVFRKFQASVADRLCKKFELYGKTIFEIGCGSGGFLKRICALGRNKGIGIDPSAPNQDYDSNLTFIRDYFSEPYTTIECDFICSLSVFEDIASIQDLLHSVRMLSARNNAPVYIEVFNGWRTFEQNEVWSIHYEQCNYFSLNALRNIVSRAGLKIIDASSCYQNDQYLFVEAIADTNLDRSPRLAAVDTEKLHDFPVSFDKRRVFWNQKIDEFRDKRIILWGSGGKGITFLNSIDAANRIDAVVDINPNRQASYIPGTGHQVISPELLTNMNPDLVIITNKIYQDEISQQLTAMGLNPEIAVA